ncbi:MAG: hypothetical protein JNK23_09175 [Opitutaceae bacterium]|nr:hypothetical protein [Opitutaceae bacterium]
MENESAAQSNLTTALRNAAFELAEEIRYGKWGGELDREKEPIQQNESAITELRSRCPGFERTDYVHALEAGIATSLATPARSTGENLRYWFAAFTFVWALPATIFIVKQVVGNADWLGLLVYPAICATAGVYLLRQKYRAPFIFVGLNLTAAVAWIVFVVWAARAFAQSFWR